MTTAPTRVGPVLRRRALRLSDAARARMDRAPVAGDEGAALLTRVEGIDPLRVLLFGSGALIGYGVRTRGDAVDGHLADLLARRSGRGVTIESRVRLALPTAEAVQSLGGAGTVTFHAAVWCPRFGEELSGGSVRRSRRAVRAMLTEYAEASSVPLVLCTLPEPLGDDWRTRLRRPRIAAFNEMLRREAQSSRCARVADSGTYRPSDPASTTGPDWHRGFAAQLFPTVAAALSLPV